MSVLISDEILQAAKMSDAELRAELAILLYQQKKLGISKAREVAGIALIEFQRELARRQIPVFDDCESLEMEVSQLKILGDL
jgi:predicted HTH domain antitoxin